MPDRKLGYERSAELGGYGVAIGTGQSILEAMRELDTEKRGNRMLSAQLENQMMQMRMNALERQAERELKIKEFGLRERELTGQESLRKAQEKILERGWETLGAGQAGYEIDPTTGRRVKIAERPFAPTAGGSKRMEELANLLLGEGKFVQDVDKNWNFVRSGEGLVDLGDYTGSAARVQKAMPMLNKYGYTDQEVNSYVESLFIKRTEEVTPEQPRAMGILESFGRKALPFLYEKETTPSPSIIPSAQAAQPKKDYSKEKW